MHPLPAQFCWKFCSMLRSCECNHGALIIQQYSWENNVLKEEEEEEEVLLPVWMIYCLFSPLMEAATAAGMWEWKLEQYSDNRGREDGETTEGHLSFCKTGKCLWMFWRTTKKVRFSRSGEIELQILFNESEKSFITNQNFRTLWWHLCYFPTCSRPND